VRHAVALAIRRAGSPGELLLVRRPPDDPDLPDAWGLPAATLRAGESWEDAVGRAASGKLGVRAAGGTVLNEGRLERKGYTLHMRLYDASIVAGEPAVPGPDPGVTQYAAWRWGAPAELRPAAAGGSLCSRLFLDHLDRASRP
jgi:ADP-ribose pyrophosphatase YjhB (NUDIX family)